MSEADRVKWDQRYAETGPVPLDAPAWLADVEHLVPTQGRALDLAAGSGRISGWLASRGLDVTAVDISPAGLELARQNLHAQGLLVKTLTADLENQPLPSGPFAVIACFLYRQRDLFPAIKTSLQPGDLFLGEVVCLDNLERHQSPSRQYLAAPGELREDCASLEILYYQEGWFDDRAVARVAARKLSRQLGGKL